MGILTNCVWIWEVLYTYILNAWIIFINMLYYKKGQSPTRGLTKLIWKHRKCHPIAGQSSRVVFLCQKHYLINVKTNVSNARMNMPKAIRSLKSNGFLFISTTPILCINKMKVKPPCNTIVLCYYSNASFPFVQPLPSYFEPLM